MDLADGKLNLEQIDGLDIYFPDTPTFANANLSDKAIVGSINQAEKNH